MIGQHYSAKEIELMDELAKVALASLIRANQSAAQMLNGTLAGLPYRYAKDSIIKRREILNGKA